MFNKELIKHLERTEKIAINFGKYLKLSSYELKNLSNSAKYHDVGKLLIDPKILYKKEKLTNCEFNDIKGHPKFSYKILKKTEEFNDITLKAILEHHERVDGCGYPFGLKDNEISNLGKILTICDCYEAMTAKRCYKEPFNKSKAINEIKKNLGTQFNQNLGIKFIDFTKKYL